MKQVLSGPDHRSDAIEIIQRGIDRLSLISAYLAAGCLGLLTLLTLCQVALGVLSKISDVFPSAIAVGWEYSAYLMGTAFMLGGALTMRAGMQIRVEIVMRMVGSRVQRLMEIVASAIGAGFVSFLALSLALFALDSYRSGQVSGASFTPLWIPQATLALGTTVYALQSIMRFLAAVLRMPLINESFKVASASE
ncbi:MAG: TRAP transporter small permease [Polaromonas sp.]|nr:TRAP transporter small permease [Polaromonas sp.]